MRGRIMWIWALSSFLVLACGDDDDPAGPPPGGDSTPARIRLSSTSLTFVEIDDSVQLTAVVENAHGDTISGVTVTWASTDEAVAVVQPSGWVVAKADGSAKIVAATGSLADTAEVEVARVPAIIVPSKSDVWVGEQRADTLKAVVQDRNGHEIPGVGVTWTSRDPAVATVTDEGVVTGRRRGGKTEIVAEAGEASTVIPVEVMDQLFFITANDGLVIVDEDGTVRSSFGGDVNNRVANAVWSPDGRKIAYAKRRNIGGTDKTDIFVFNVDTRADQQLTDSGSDFSPTWSPDGSRIAFISRRGGLITPELFVMNATTGAGVTRLTNNTNQDTNPVWAPVGNLIAVQRHVGGNYEIVVVNANTGAETVVTNNSNHEIDPAWFPDGSRVLYRRLNSSGVAGQYFSVRPDGSDVQSHN